METILTFGKRLDACVFKVQKPLLIILCILITAINIAQIAGRYLFFYSIPWSEQLSVVLFVAITFLGQNIATKTDNEIRIDIISLQSASRRKLFLIVSDLACLATLAVLFASAIQLIRNALRFPQVISSLSLPYYIVFSVLPLGFALIFFSRLGVLIRRFAPSEETEQEGNA